MKKNVWIWNRNLYFIKWTRIAPIPSHPGLSSTGNVYVYHATIILRIKGKGCSIPRHPRRVYVVTDLVKSEAFLYLGAYRVWTFVNLDELFQISVSYNC